MRLLGKVALVTGASRGIGRAIALAFANEGADVIVNYVRQAEAAAEVRRQIEDLGRRSLVVQADTSRRDQVEALMEQGWQALGKIDLLVNNAGIETIIPLLDLDDTQWEQVTDVNLRGPWLCSQVFARRLISASLPGAIVNIGSIQSGLALPGRTHYAPTKRGVEALTRNLAAELAPVGIRVNCIHPGVIETDMTQWVIGNPEILPVVLDKIPLHRQGQPEEVAPAAVFFASDDASYITGQSLFVDGGMLVV